MCEGKASEGTGAGGHGGDAPAVPAQRGQRHGVAALARAYGAFGETVDHDDAFAVVPFDGCGGDESPLRSRDAEQPVRLFTRSLEEIASVLPAVAGTPHVVLAGGPGEGAA